MKVITLIQYGVQRQEDERSESRVTKTQGKRLKKETIQIDFSW